jgi:putative transposase
MSARHPPIEVVAMPNEGTDRVRLRLVEQVLRLPAARLAEVEAFLARLPLGVPALQETESGRGSHPDWPHAPLHRLSEQGTYIVTAGTHQKQHIFRGPDRLDYLQATLLSLAKETGWQLEAWAVFSNHYHFVAHAQAGSKSLRELLRRLHGSTSRHVNLLDQSPGRQVWFNFWDTQLTFEKSYLARLNYVQQNPVKHGLVPAARLYRWCSADWFERTVSPAMVRLISRFKIDKVNVEDNFEPV